jgi:hypothetical protein
MNLKTLNRNNETISKLLLGKVGIFAHSELVLEVMPLTPIH